jgi:hypothetical protein
MDEALRLVATYGGSLSAIGAAVGFIWSVIQFFSVRKREAEERQFEVFHRLIKELVEPPKDGPLYIDRQCAVLYELRFFPRYFPFTRRTLLGLKVKWAVVEFPRLLEELEITLNLIEEQRGVLWRRALRALRLSSQVED